MRKVIDPKDIIAKQMLAKIATSEERVDAEARRLQLLQAWKKIQKENFEHCACARPKTFLRARSAHFCLHIQGILLALAQTTLYRRSTWRG